MGRRAVTAVLFVALLVEAPAAGAATVHANVWYDEYGLQEGTFVFQAAPGERNRLSLSSVGADYLIRDREAIVRAGGDCVRVDPDTARCPQYDPVDVRLGDGADRLTARVGAVVYGGSGDDVLLAGPVSGELHGGAGDDVVRGGGGPDWLVGGAGEDRVKGGAGQDVLADGEQDRRAAGDRYDGGSGRDQLIFGYLRRALRVDLRRGRTDAGDRVQGVENVTSGNGDDVLLGDARDNELWPGEGDDVVGGGAGRDLISGAGGADRLFGGAGADYLSGDGERDRLSGGAGDDLLSTGEQAAAIDILSCGAGVDHADADDSEFLPPSCERTSALNGLEFSIHPTVDADSADFTVWRCPLYLPCAGRFVLALRGGQEPVAEADFTLTPPAAGVVVAVPLSPIAAELLRSGAVVQVRVELPTGEPDPFSAGYQTFMVAPAAG